MAPFVYQTLEPNHIRLLYLLPSTSPDLDKIECEIVRVHIDQAKDYEALSYVWGPPDAIESTIQIQSPNRQLWKSASSSSLRITSSLLIALWHLRYASQRRHLWIDQICINQADTLEKNAQVRRMGEIYRKAQSTVVWLGPRDDEDAMLLMEMHDKLSVLPVMSSALGGVRMLDQKALVEMIGTTVKHDRESEVVRKRRLLLERFMELAWFGRVW